MDFRLCAKTLLLQLTDNDGQISHLVFPPRLTMITGLGRESLGGQTMLKLIHSDNLEYKELTKAA